MILLFLLRLSAERRPKAPDLAADCAKPAFTLSKYEVDQARPVAYTIVGPEGRDYVLGVNTSTFARAADGGWDAVPRAGRTQDDVLVAAAPEPMKGCSRSGYFATPLPLGTQTATLYELTDAGAVFVAEQRFEVVEP